MKVAALQFGRTIVDRVDVPLEKSVAVSIYYWYAELMLSRTEYISNIVEEHITFKEVYADCERYVRLEFIQLQGKNAIWPD